MFDKVVVERKKLTISAKVFRAKTGTWEDLGVIHEKTWSERVRLGLRDWLRSWLPF